MAQFIAGSCHGCVNEGEPGSPQCTICDNYDHFSPNTGPSLGFKLKKAHTTKKCTDCGTTISRGNHFYKKVSKPHPMGKVKVETICCGCESRRYYDQFKGEFQS